MKKQLKLIGTVVVATLLLMACNKEQQQTNAVAEQFKRVDQLEDERLLFSMMTAREKTDLASQHLDFCADYYGFSQAQRNALVTIKSNLLAAYSSNDPENAPETAAIQLDVNQYFSSLTKEQRLVTFSSMVLDDAGVQALIGDSGTGASSSTDCNCSSTSNFCSSSWGPSIVCDKTSKCGKSSWGCGTLWLYSCNGKCKLFS